MLCGSRRGRFFSKMYNERLRRVHVGFIRKAAGRRFFKVKLSLAKHYMHAMLSTHLSQIIGESHEEYGQVEI